MALSPDQYAQYVAQFGGQPGATGQSLARGANSWAQQGASTQGWGQSAAPSANGWTDPTTAPGGFSTPAFNPATSQFDPSNQMDPLSLGPSGFQTQGTGITPIQQNTGAQGAATAQNPFYTPGQSYGGTQAWDQTPLVQNYLDPQIPRGVYQSYLENNGLGGPGRNAQWAQSLGTYRNTDYGYQAALRQNPTLSFNDYLGQQYGNNGLQNIFNSFDPRSRGENPAQYAGNGRLIGWG